MSSSRDCVAQWGTYIDIYQILREWREGDWKGSAGWCLHWSWQMRKVLTGEWQSGKVMSEAQNKKAQGHSGESWVMRCWVTRQTKDSEVRHVLWREVRQEGTGESDCEDPPIPQSSYWCQLPWGPPRAQGRQGGSGSLCFQIAGEVRVTGGTVYKQEEHLGNEVMRMSTRMRGWMWERNGSLRGEPEAVCKQVFLFVCFFNLRRHQSVWLGEWKFAGKEGNGWQ